MASKYLTRDFANYVAERAGKTVAQVLAASIVVGQPVQAQDWTLMLSIAATAGVASVLTSFLGYRGDGTDDPNNTGEPPAAPATA